MHFTAATRPSSHMHNYSSYLIRHWLLGNDSDERSQVFDIEHVESGRRTSLRDAEPWIEAITGENQFEVADSQSEDY
jgi:hypothetical protein